MSILKTCGELVGMLAAMSLSKDEEIAKRAERLSQAHKSKLGTTELGLADITNLSRSMEPVEGPEREGVAPEGFDVYKFDAPELEARCQRINFRQADDEDAMCRTLDTMSGVMLYLDEPKGKGRKTGTITAIVGQLADDTFGMIDWYPGDPVRKYMTKDPPPDNTGVWIHNEL